MPSASAAAQKAAKKRKLSVSAGSVSAAQIKRSKSGEAAQKDPAPSKPSGPDNVEGEDEDDDQDGSGDEKADDDAKDDAKDDTKDDANGKDKGSTGDSSRPMVFYLWADAIISLFEDEGSEAIFRLKSDVKKAWEELKKHEGDDDYCYSDPTGHWGASVDEEAQETKAAKKLVAKWNAIRRTGHDLANSGWWWEIVMQRAKPSSSVAPAMRIELVLMEGPDDEVGEGTWWVTDIREADASEKGNPALHYFADNVPYID